MAAKRKSYDDKFRASAVVMLEAAEIAYSSYN